MKTFHFYRLHITALTQTEGEQEFFSRHQFLEALDRWNAQQPGVWQYWSKPQ